MQKRNRPTVTLLLQESVSSHSNNNNNNSSEDLKALDKLAESHFISVLNNLDKQVKARRKRRKEYEEDIYQKWKEPVDLLEGLIDFCLNVGEKKRKELSRKDLFNNKHAALVKLHARSLLISNEIVTLVRGGYADGAHSRWRSLFELEVIAGFLSEQEQWVSERFLQHETMRGYKKMRNYQKYCSRLGYESFTEEEMKEIERNHDLMIEKYGKEYEYFNGWEWIPSEIVKERNLTGLAKYVKVDHFRPYYELSSDGIHGGPKGFNHMGLPKHLRNGILLVGSSILGMTDSLHSTAISLQRATLYLIKQETNSSNIIEMKVMEKIVYKIGQSSLEIHQDLEKNDHNRKT